MRALIYTLAALAGHASAASYGPELEGFPYPYPLRHYSFSSQGTSMQMAYMDVAPSGAANGKTAVLLHGKNFCGATWEQSIAALSAAGYRVPRPSRHTISTPSSNWPPTPTRCSSTSASSRRRWSATRPAACSPPATR
jgi:hypothetical protein